MFAPRFTTVNSSRKWVDEGLQYYRAKRYEEALLALEQAIRLDPNDVLAQNSKGAALRDLHRYEEALSAFEQSIRLNPDDALAHQGIGATLVALKRYGEALAAYNQAIRLDP